MGFLHRHRGLTPYLLLAPGIAVAARLLRRAARVPRLPVAASPGIFDVGYTFTWAWGNYCDALSTLPTQFIRSLEYAGIATVLALAAELSRSRTGSRSAAAAGRTCFLLLIIAPFFVTYLIRTLAWETILSDNGFVVHTLQHLHVLGPDGRLLATSTAVVAGITYNFLPFMVLPLYVSLEQIDQRLIEAAEDLYASKCEGVPARDAAALAARRRRRHAADVHPGGRRLHQRAAARDAAAIT